MSDIAQTVSSIGVVGSGRWQNSRSTKSRPRRSNDAVDGLEQVLAVQRVAHVRRVVDPPEQLGRQHVAVARPAQLGDGLAHDALGLAAGVGLGVVEEVDARLAGRVEAVDRQLVLSAADRT